MFYRAAAWFVVITASVAWAGEPEQGSFSPSSAEKLSQALRDFGDTTDMDDVLERGVLATIGRNVAASYGKTSALHLNVKVMSGMRLLPAEEIPSTGGLSLEQLERLVPELQQDAVVDWKMTDRQEFAVQIYLGGSRSKEPSWQMVSRYLAGPTAVEAAGGEVTEPYPLKGYWEGRQPRLFPNARYNCGEFAMFPFSLVGDWSTDQSPRASWSWVFSRGIYEGYLPASNGQRCHRVAWIQCNRDDSVNRVFRLYVDPTTWRVVQIDELGPVLGFNNKVVAVLGMAWRFEELPVSSFDEHTFSFEKLRGAIDERKKLTAQAATVATP